MPDPITHADAEGFRHQAAQARADGRTEDAEGFDALARIADEPEMSDADELRYHAARLREMGAGDAAGLLEARAAE